MAIVINPEILGQECSSAITYCYLFEPLRINIAETDVTAKKLFIEIERRDIANTAVVVPFLTGVTSLVKYVEVDLLPNKSVTIDFAEIMVQLHSANVFKISTIADIITSNEEMVTSRYIYSFKITTDKTLTQVLVNKLPIIGGRDYKKFNPTVGQNQPLNEFEYYGLDQAEIATRWSNFVFYKAHLVALGSTTNVKPTIVPITSPLIEYERGGVLYWKSRFGGWMFWGFDIEKGNETGSYQGDLEVQMFESTKRINGAPYVPIDYSSISSSHSIELKSLGLSNLELLAVSGISSSPAIYYAADNSGKLELMRLSSATAPFNNLATGGDFSVSLQSISKTNQKTV